MIAVAQAPGGFNRQGGGQNMNLGHFYGKVIDSATNKPVDGATIQLTGPKFDTVTKRLKKILFTPRSLQKSNGNFSIENLPIFTSFKLHITVIGYKEYKNKHFFRIKMQEVPNRTGRKMMNMIDKDLGNIKMEADAKHTRGSNSYRRCKTFFEMGVDRKIFNVDKNIVTGQTATELMKQIPSVNVDIDGNATLRNATPRFLSMAGQLH